MKNKIRILHIIDQLGIGGTEKQCVTIVKYLSKEKYYIHVLTLNKNGPLFEDLDNANIPLTEIAISGRFWLIRCFNKVLEMAFFMRKLRFDIVQTYGYSSTVPGVIAAMIARIPIIISGKRDMNVFLSPLRVRFEKVLWKFSKKIVVNSNAIKYRLVSHNGIAEDKITVIYNGIDLPQYNHIPITDYRSRNPIVGMIANFSEIKDHKTFLLAASRVIREKPDTMFYLAGSGHLETELRKFAQALGIYDKVVFCGMKIGYELYDFINALSISVLCSRSEGLPNAVLESMAFGIPVIATFTGGIPEIIDDGITGYLFPPKRDDILAIKILHLLNNKDKANEIGKMGMKKIKEIFSLEKMINSFENLYDRIL